MRRDVIVPEGDKCWTCGSADGERHLLECAAAYPSILRRAANLLFRVLRRCGLAEASWHSSDENRERRRHRQTPAPARRPFNGRLFNKRAWFNLTERHSLHVEAQAPVWKCAAQLTVRDMEGQAFVLHVAVPLLFQVFVSVSTPGLWKLAAWIMRRVPESLMEDSCARYSPWTTGFTFHGGSLWVHPFVPDHVGYGRASGKPWWCRTRCIDFRDLLLGRMEHQHEVLGDWQPVLVPMIEGAYPGRVRFERRTWRRPRLPRFTARVRDITEFQADESIPFPGKGENSWDCGMDGLCGIGCEGHDIEKCIGTVVASVLHSRQRYAGRRDWMPPRGWREREREENERSSVALAAEAKGP